MAITIYQLVMAISASFDKETVFVHVPRYCNRKKSDESKKYILTMDCTAYYPGIAFAAAFIDGLIRIKIAKIPLMKKTNRRRFSIFTWGLEDVLRLLWANVKFQPVFSP
ncbi:MAG: hypothetical protein K2M63_04345 [Muribaculaceae bacterium]|nr:hypothetical protein [Muribaculaceae bacterium]